MAFLLGILMCSAKQKFKPANQGNKQHALIGWRNVMSGIVLKLAKILCKRKATNINVNAERSSIRCPKKHCSKLEQFTVKSHVMLQIQQIQVRKTANVRKIVYLGLAPSYKERPNYLQYVRYLLYLVACNFYCVFSISASLAAARWCCGVVTF